MVGYWSKNTTRYFDRVVRELLGQSWLVSTKTPFKLLTLLEESSLADSSSACSCLLVLMLA